ncbi:MAG: hypothetical protein ACI4SG_09460 [Oligosphaeraceae bacterium]
MTWREKEPAVPPIPPAPDSPQRDRTPLAEAIRMRLHLSRALQARLLGATPRTCRNWARGTHRPLPGKLYRALRQAHADHLLQELDQRAAFPPFTPVHARELELHLLFWRLALFHFLLKSSFPGHLHCLGEHLQATLVHPPNPHPFPPRKK